MRTVLILAMFTASLAMAAKSDYEERRDLRLDAGGIERLEVKAGAGGLEVTGSSLVDDIVVAAHIRVPVGDADDALEVIDSDLVLTLEQAGDTAVLNAYFEDRAWRWGDSPAVHIEVTLPERLSLGIDDGSGPIVLTGVTGDIVIEDGSGSIEMSHVGGDVSVRDGSGSISASDIGADIRIDDGSGSITVERVGGSVTVDDGSGSINVHDVQEDLIIESDGSGGLDFSGIAGKVAQDG